LNRVTSVSAVRVISSFSLDRSDPNFGWFVSGRDRSDPAAHAKHYKQLKKETKKEVKDMNDP